MKRKSGISLIVLVVTIIVMIIISGAVIITLTATNVIDQAENATAKYNKQQYKVMIGNEYAIIKTSEDAKAKTTEEKYLMLKDKMNLKELNWTITQNIAYIEVNSEYILTLFEDGTIKEGKIVILDIANGSIELYEKGYIQGQTVLGGTDGTQFSAKGEFVEFSGNYIITGTSNENMVKITEKGTYNITLKDLHIDSSSIKTCCAFNANRGGKKTDLYVNIYLEGENTLKSGYSAAGLGFSKGEANMKEFPNASRLTIQGDGSLYAEGGTYSAGIGSGYTGWDSAGGEANNIIINSGNITAQSGGSDCAGIGGGLRQNANNIIINGGNVVAISTRSNAIGTTSRDGTGTLKNLEINGGNITAVAGEYGSAIGGETGSGNIKITGGVLNFRSNSPYATNYSILGHKINQITITGGTIICTTKKGSGIGTKDITKNINITGGSIYLNVKGEKYAVSPISGQNNVYLAELQLQNVTEEVKVTSFVTSDNIDYGIKDMYTTVDGKLYLYLPTGERTITIVTGDKEYTGTVVTGEADATEVVVLSEK